MIVRAAELHIPYYHFYCYSIFYIPAAYLRVIVRADNYYHHYYHPVSSGDEEECGEASDNPGCSRSCPKRPRPK